MHANVVSLQYVLQEKVESCHLRLNFDRIRENVVELKPRRSRAKCWPKLAPSLGAERTSMPLAPLARAWGSRPGRVNCSCAWLCRVTSRRWHNCSSKTEPCETEARLNPSGLRAHNCPNTTNFGRRPPFGGQGLPNLVQHWPNSANVGRNTATVP